MPLRTIPTIDGGEMSVAHRHPRQSEILNLHAHLVGAPAQEQYERYLEWFAGLVTSIDGDTVTPQAAADILDERVMWTTTVEAANAVVAARLPAPEVLGNSESGGGS